MRNWEVQQLRLTIFPQFGSELDPDKLWMSVIGEEPELVQAHPKQGVLLMQNPYHLGMLKFNLLPDRIHWVYEVPKNSDDLDSSLGSIDATLSKFAEIANKLFSIGSKPSAIRIAIGLILDSPVQSKEEGYQALSELLSYVEIDRNSSDFLYQINRPRKMRLGETEIEINRLSKWSVAVQVQSQFVFQLGSTKQGSVKSLSGNKMVSCHLELDISTDEDNQRAFDHGEQKSIFDRLIEQAKEIYEKGDIP